MGGTLESYSYVKCKAAALSGDFGLSGTAHVAENGSLLQAVNLSDIQADLYPYCKANRGLGSNFNNFTVFSSDASLWFLPWFALLAQPYSTRNIAQDFFIMILTVGAPTMALLSLFVTILNRHWLENVSVRIRNDKSWRTGCSNSQPHLRGFK
jgi:hypothetical protein